MSVTQAEMHQLYESVKTNLGSPAAETFMNVIPPSGWADIATKRDLALLGAEFHADMAELRAETRTEFAMVRSEIAGLRAELKTDMGELRSDLLRTLGTWLFASQAAVIATVSVLFAVFN